MLTLKGWLLSVAALLQLAAATPRDQICPRVEIALGGGLNHGSLLLELGLVTSDGRLHPDARKHFPLNHKVTYLHTKAHGMTVEAAFVNGPDGKPSVLRVNSFARISTGGQFQDATPTYYRVNPDQTLTLVESPLKIHQARFGSDPLPKSPLPVSLDRSTLPGPQVHSETQLTARISGDPSAMHVTHNQVALVIRPSAGPSPELDVNRVYTYGMGPCVGVFMEGKNFAVVSHLVSAETSPPDYVLRMILKKISEEGLSTEGMKVRVVGGEDHHPTLAEGMIQAVRAQNLDLIETDVLGKEGKQFSSVGRALGYRFAENEIPIPIDLK